MRLKMWTTSQPVTEEAECLQDILGVLESMERLLLGIQNAINDLADKR